MEGESTCPSGLDVGMKFHEAVSNKEIMQFPQKIRISMPNQNNGYKQCLTPK